MPFLDDAYRLRKESVPHKVALRIIENLSDVIIDVELNEFHTLIKDNPFYKKLFKREGKTFKAKKSWSSTISFDSNVDSLYLVHPDYITNYKEIREKTGSLLVCNDSDINLLGRMNDKRGYICIVPEEDRIGHLDSGYQDSWEDAINTCKVEPINSLIITDNYLFSDIEKRKNTGLFSLLRAVVPTNLCVPFHLAIFSHIGNNLFHQKEAEKLIAEIKSLFPKDTIKVTIIIHTKKSTTHDREMLSNYHRFTSGAGFSVIKDEDGIAEVAKGNIEPVYHALVTTLEDHMTTKHFHFQTLHWLKSIYRREVGIGGGSFIVGDKDHRMLD
ncbi:hypothetical protein [uncultured Muribaculum sp.]|uniref:hypothetical protein n=1 Tax=uncultured Muribaculum sp. TaxID=1918613 RepID=UPI0027304CFC|nr:hypothetical protein [uncultured Muribaculum sp.]